MQAVPRTVTGLSLPGLLAPLRVWGTLPVGGELDRVLGTALGLHTALRVVAGRTHRRWRVLVNRDLARPPPAHFCGGRSAPASRRGRRTGLGGGFRTDGTEQCHRPRPWRWRSAAARQWISAVWLFDPSAGRLRTKPVPMGVMAVRSANRTAVTAATATPPSCGEDAG